MQVFLQADTKANLYASLVAKGVLVSAQADTTTASGIQFNYAGLIDGKETGIVTINELTSNVNPGGTPVPVTAMNGMLNRSLQSALESLGLIVPWENAIIAACQLEGSRKILIWWERSTFISRYDSYWYKIVSQMQWGTSSEALLLDEVKKW